jgi:hypothetical protein
MKLVTALALAGAIAVAPVALAQDKAKTTAPATPAAAPATTPAAAPAKTADTAKTPNSQQERMKSCNEQAKGKTGDDRKKFMSSCLSGDAPKMTQQEKMTACNKKATGMKGDERKKYMSSCLSA